MKPLPQSASDDDIRKAARRLGWPITYVPLDTSFVRDGPDVAEVDFRDPREPVRRYVSHPHLREKYSESDHK